MASRGLKSWCAGTLARVCAVLPGKRSGAIVIPPAGPGSLGDEAMCEAVANQLQRAGVSPVSLIARKGHDPWPELSGVDEFIEPPAGTIGRLLQMLSLMRRRKYVFVVGADCIDGHYMVWLSVQLIDLVDLGARSGATSTLLGCSYKPNAKPETADALRCVAKNARLNSRDPVSAQRMRDATGRDIRTVADPAFMLEPSEPRTGAAEFDAWFGASDAPTLGVNFNHQVLKKAPQEEIDRLFESYVTALLDLHGRLGVRVLLVPHDYRQEPHDLTYAERLLERLSPAMGDDVMLFSGRRTPGEVKGVAGRLDAALTGRMHFAVACLGRGTPPACVTYQGKFEGLMQHFGLERMTIAPEEAMEDAGALASLVESVLERRGALRSSIEGGLPALRAKSFENLPEELRPDARRAPGEA